MCLVYFKGTNQSPPKQGCCWLKVRGLPLSRKKYLANFLLLVYYLPGYQKPSSTWSFKISQRFCKLNNIGILLILEWFHVIPSSLANRIPLRNKSWGLITVVMKGKGATMWEAITTTTKKVKNPEKNANSKKNPQPVTTSKHLPVSFSPKNPTTTNHQIPEAIQKAQTKIHHCAVHLLHCSICKAIIKALSGLACLKM